MAAMRMEYFPLKSAYLCQDCENVGNSATQCPACASAALLSLSCVMNREAAEDVMTFHLPIAIDSVRGAVRAA